MQLGSTLRELNALARELYPQSEHRRGVLLQNVASELGTSKITVADFLLHRYEVTNEQYRVFVQQTGHRAPYPWWRRGRPEHFKERRAAARAEFPGKLSMLRYWDRHHSDLPWSIPEGEEQFPVTFVSWEDAQEFCAWAGVRLPVEAEWIRAARGDDRRAYVMGESWEESWLEVLGLAGTRDKRLKPVGVVAGARGPMGHDGLVGSVWEWTDTRGYFPVSGADAFRREVERSRGKALTAPSGTTQCIVKGGSFLSWSDPVQFRIDARGHPDAAETLESLGFRMAVDVAPGRAASRARLRTNPYRGAFGNLGLHHGGQIGADRYQLDAAGALIRGYSTISIVPRTQLGLERRANLSKLREASLARPLPVAALVTTEALSVPRVDPGVYALCYRDRGLPPALVEALRKARRARAGAAVPGSDVLRRYGIDPAGARTMTPRQVTVIQLRGGLEIDPSQRQLLLRNEAGTYVASLPLEQDVKSKSRYQGARLSIERTDKDETFAFEFGALLQEGGRASAVFSLSLVAAEKSADGEPWRVPAR